MTEGLTVFETISSLLSTLFGVGMYFVPSAFAQSGILLGCVQLLFVTGLSILSIYCLFDYAYHHMDIKISTDEEEGLNKGNICHTEKEPISYASLGSKVHKIIGWTIEFMIVIAGFFTCLFFQKYISIISSSLVANTQEEETTDWYRIFIGIYGLIIFMVGQFKNLESISFLGKISCFCICIITFIVFVLNVICSDFINSHVPNAKKIISSSVINTFVFAMDCQANVVEAFDCMKKKSRKTMWIVAFAAPLLAAIIYGAMGIMGSRLFGDYMPKEDIISIIANKNSDLSQYLFNRNDIFSYIPYIIPVLAIVGLLISIIFQLSAVTRSLTKMKILANFSPSTRVFISTLFCVVGFSVINRFPEISLNLVFTIIGQFMSNFLGYLFPFIFCYVLYKRKYPLVIVLASIVFGFYGFIDYLINEWTIDTSTLLANTTLIPQTTETLGLNQ